MKDCDHNVVKKNDFFRDLNNGEKEKCGSLLWMLDKLIHMQYKNFVKKTVFFIGYKNTFGK